MIPTPAQALDLILDRVEPIPATGKSLSEVLGLAVAEALNSQAQVPPFTNSAMDGYAVRAVDLRDASLANPVRLRVLGDLAAGAIPHRPMGPGDAFRIMTGAPLPEGADSVVPVEDTTQVGDWVELRMPLRKGVHIRLAGEDLQLGQLLVKAGQGLRPGDIGVLAAAGIPEVPVHPRVRVAVLTTGMTVIQSLLLAHTTTRLDMRLMAEFYRHVLSLPMSFFLSVNKGEILSRFGENQKIRHILTGSTITTVMNVLMLVIYFFMMFAYSAKLSIIVIIFLPIFIAIVMYFTPRLKRVSQEIFLSNTQAQSALIESLNGIEPIKATSNEYFARARWENAFVENVNRGFHQQRLSLMNSSVFQLAILGMTTTVLWVGASQVIGNQMTVGELMGFQMLMGLVTSPVLQMVNLWSQLQEVRISVDRVAEFLDQDPEHEVATTPNTIRRAVGQLEGKIDFRNVFFSYRAGKDTMNIMQDFNLSIEQGQRIAFVGPAGCGKSTIAKMVLGFNIPQRGEVTIDGININQMDISSLRRNIGVVLQDSFLFAGSVAQNIAFGDPEPDMQTVQDVARLAGAEEFILKLPLGYETPIGEKGQALSGGQRQRICIARALYRRPRIMIFDEATSALDNQTEELIIKQLKEKVLPGRTSISIAHRLTTIMNSDRICFIRDGIVQEQGTHHQLIDPLYIKEMNYKGMYYNLARTQFNLPPLGGSMLIDLTREQKLRLLDRFGFVPEAIEHQHALNDRLLGEIAH